MNEETKNEKPEPTRGPQRKRWSAEEKLRAVLEANQLSDQELGAFLRREGLHEAQLNEWRSAVSEAALAALSSSTSRKARGMSPEQKRVRELEKELHRKEKALAEVAALLALKKKAQEIWGEEDDDMNTGSGT